MTERSGSRSVYFSMFFGCVLTCVVGTQAAMANVLLITLPDREALSNPDWPDESSAHDAAYIEPTLPVVTLAPDMSVLPAATEDSESDITSDLSSTAEDLFDQVSTDCSQTCLTAWNRFVIDTIVRDPVAALVASVSSSSSPITQQHLAPATSVANSVEFNHTPAKTVKLSPFSASILFRPLLLRGALALDSAADSLKSLAKELTTLSETSSPEATAEAAPPEDPKQSPSHSDSAGLPFDPAADAFFDF